MVTDSWHPINGIYVPSEVLHIAAAQKPSRRRHPLTPFETDTILRLPQESQSVSP